MKKKVKQYRAMQIEELQAKRLRALADKNQLTLSETLGLMIDIEEKDGK